MFVAINLVAATCARGQSQSPFVSTWQGALDVGQTKLRLVLKIFESGKDSLKASLDSPDQGASDIPASGVRTTGDSVVVEFNSMLAKYEGVLQQDKNSLSGMWKQGGAVLPLTLARSSDVPKPRRPQNPVKPYPYVEEEIAYENKKGGVKLAGTFTKPAKGGPFPAVILISGSGPQDRNETVFGHSPFLVLADYLTRRGIAVLRVDDRGVGGSTGNVMLSTSDDFSGDVLAGIEYLKQRSDVRKKQIGLVGHSEGGIVAPMVAAKTTDVAFIVLMAGTGLPGDQILLLQTGLIMKAAGLNDESIEKAREHNNHVYGLVKSNKDSVLLSQRLGDYLMSSWSHWGEQYEKQGIEKEKAIEALVRQVTTPWFRYFLTYDPRSALQNVKCPVLAINGELDVQVAAKENLSQIEAALKKAGNKNVTMKELPGLNHLFQTSKTGSLNEYGSIEETTSPETLKIIGDWMELRTSR